MILVLLGTQNNQFIRLLDEIEKNIENGNINEEVIVQAGYTKYTSKNMKIFQMIDSLKLQQYIDEADLIITHGGVGSIIGAVERQKKVIAVPRLSKYSEHVNNHQLNIVKKFNEKQHIIGIEDVSELSKALEKVKDFVPAKYEEDNSKIIGIIEDFINNN